MTKRVIILRGVSGSGKSTVAQILFNCEELGTAYICSADKAFMDNGEYKFDVSKLEQAHADCFAEFVECLSKYSKIQTVIVDNTNLSNWEIAPYITYARYTKAEIEIMDVESGLSAEQLAKRNVHGVPLNSIKNMMARKEKLLPHWQKYVVKEE